MRLTGVLALLAAAIATARADGIATPRRLTVGDGDQFAATRGPVADEVWFVGNEGGLPALYKQALPAGPARLVLEEPAETTAPRLSPDGKTLAYLSRRDDANGRLCVRELQRFDQRRCFGQPARAHLDLLWDGDGALLAIERASLEDDPRLVRFARDGSAPAAVLARAALANPALSPDGKWLVAIPLGRRDPQVGVQLWPRRLGPLEIRARETLDRARPLALDLPGPSSHPSFSPDGAYLYFAQYLNDNNQDGRIDGADHAVLFRVRFDGKRGEVILPAEQLTSAAQSCTEPLRVGARLLAACESEGKLHLHELPPDGVIPATWDEARVRAELATRSDGFATLLLLRHLYERLEAQSQPLLAALVLHHLLIDEIEAALHYTQRLAAIEPTTARLLTLLARQRQATLAFGRGATSESYLSGTRARLEELGALGPQLAGGARDRVVLAAAVKATLLFGLVEIDQAQATLDAAPLEALTDAPLGRHVAALAETLARARDDRDALTRTLARLGRAEGLDLAVRLELGRRLTEEVRRGRPARAIPAALARARGAEPSDADVDHDAVLFAIALEQSLHGLSVTSQENVRQQLMELYRRHKDRPHRAALVDAALERSAQRANDYLLYQMANTWVSYVRPNEAGRDRAEQQYREVVLERAYIELARRNFADARGHFYAVTLQSDDLEAHVGFVEAALAEPRDVRADYRQRYPQQPLVPIRRFIETYLEVRALARQPLTASALPVLARAATELSALSQRLPDAPLVHHLLGHVTHLRFLLGHDRQEAQRAVSAYRTAASLGAARPQLLAATLMGQAALEVALGNYGQAAAHLQARGQWPRLDPSSELGACLALARSWFLLDKISFAVQQSGSCKTLLAASPSLSRYAPLLLDRAGLYALAAGAGNEAEGDYSRLLSLLPSGPAPNRALAQLGRAASRLLQRRAQEADADARAAFDALDGSVVIGALERPFAEDNARIWDTPTARSRRLRTILLGLRARARFLAGDFAEARALEERRLQFGDKSLADNHLRDRLDGKALVAATRLAADDAAGALTELEEALALWDDQRAASAIRFLPVAHRILVAYVELYLSDRLPRARFARNPLGRLAEQQDLLRRAADPAWRGLQGELTFLRALAKLKEPPP